MGGIVDGLLGEMFEVCKGEAFSRPGIPAWVQFRPSSFGSVEPWKVFPDATVALER